MAAPLEVSLTHLRRVVVDVQGPDWRVAYYAPDDLEAVLKLERRAKRGDHDARERLRRVELTRSTGKAPALADALLMAGLEDRESAEIAVYIHSHDYARREFVPLTPEPEPEEAPPPAPEPEPAPPVDPEPAEYVQETLA